LDTGPKASAQAAEFQRQMATLSAVSVGEMQKVLGAFGGPGGLNSLLEIATKTVIVVGTTFEAVFSQIQENILMLTGPIAEVAAQIAEGDLVGAFRAMQRTAGEFASGLAGLVPGVNAVRLVDAAFEGVSEGIARADEAIAAMHKTIDGGTKRGQDGYRGLGREVAAVTTEVEKANEASAAASAIFTQRAQQATDLARGEEELEGIRSDSAVAEAQRTDDAIKLAQIRYEQERDALQARIDAAIELGADEVEAAEVYQERLGELELERIDAVKEAEAILAEQRREDIKRQIDDVMQVASVYTQLGQEATRAVVNDRMAQGEKLRRFLEENEESLSKAQKKRIKQSLESQHQAVVKAFRMQQAADVSAIAMATAVAIMRAYELGPVAGSVAAAGLVTLGGVQTAAVMQQQPPTFDLGGMVPMGTQAGSGRHTMATLEAGEGVLTRQGVAAAGGPEGIEALNAGRGSGGGGGPTVVQLKLRHRVLDQVMTEHAGRGGTGYMGSTRSNPYRGVPR
jgi:hypothetical protein